MVEQTAHTTTSPARRHLRCVVVTPETTLVDQPASFVTLPLFDGQIGIAPLHSPLIGRLGYGEMRITSEGQTRLFYVDGGFVQVASDVVSVLTARAIPAAQLNALAAADQLAAARGREAHTPELMMLRDRSVSQARAQLRLARRAQGV